MAETDVEGSSWILCVAVIGVLVLASAGTSQARSKPAKKHHASGQLVACIELIGEHQTRRDLKLRVGKCEAHEQRVDWPPTGGRGAKGPPGPRGPVGPPGPPVHTFTAVYRQVGSGTATFSVRNIVVIPG